VTDPAGKWKTFTNDVLGNLVTVVEPDPANQPGGTLSTSYSYDWMNHLTGVSMPRAGVTQTRTFVYSDAGNLTSATNPENGTVSYSYNSDNTLQYKIDAKGQKTAYTYDGSRRVTEIQRYLNASTEDTCQRVNYTYDSNAVNPSFSQYTTGRYGAI
jgi:YD repeat-containing protein